MSEPFLIAHLVRGEPAFDIAKQMECAVCHGTSCDECEEGHWWIIPTSGHRAYPYWHLQLDHAVDWEMVRINQHPVGEPPSPWPDHYAINNRALRSAPSSSLADRLGLNLRQSSAPIRRRV